MKAEIIKLLEIAESTNALKTIPPDSKDWCSDVAFPAKDGWTVVLFYDCGELDYIDHFISPSGEKISFWDWPDSEEKNILMGWTCVGDLERLLNLEAIDE